MDGPLRDLVNGQGCDDGSTRGYRNPLGKFVDHLYRDKSQREQQEWSDFGQPQLNNKHEHQLSTQTSMEGQVESFLNGFNNPGFGPQQMGPPNMDPLGTMNLNFDEFETFMKEGNFQNMPPDMNQLSPEVPTDLLKEYIKSFISASRSQANFRPMNLPDFGLSDTEKMKIKNRSEVLAKQIYAEKPAPFIDSQVDAFLNSFGPQTGRTKGRYDETESWVQEFQQMPEGHLHPEEMERIYQQSVHTNKWVDDFEEFHKEGKMEEAWGEAQDTQRWVDEFEGVRPVQQLGKSDLRDLTASITQQIKDPKLQSTNFMKFMHKISEGQVTFDGNKVVEKSPSELEADTWADEFGKYMDKSEGENWAQEFREQHGEAFPDNWLNEFEQFSDEQQWVQEFNNMYVAPNEYQFVDPAENPYMDHPHPFDKGLKLFQEGKISESILAFEAELHRNPENAECWQHLGIAHAENDKDNKAISALLRATKLNPDNRDAALALAVSYTNEMFRDEALDTLKAWLESHPEYQNIRIPSPDFAKDGYNFKSYHDSVTDGFIMAANLRPNEPDPDVQTALGLLFNLSMDYDKAVDCFRAALTMRPDDYQLWNKLGATLANSNHSDEALGCYYKALQIKPSYVRARANLGISYMALKDYIKAAQYFLGALEMHPEAKHIWTNLQMVFMSMDRPDLLEKAADMKTDLFKDEFEF